MREYLDKVEAAEIVGVSAKTIERAILRGELRAFKPASRIRIHRSDLDAWIQSTVVTRTIYDV